MNYFLEGKTAFVSGSTKGIGAAIAKKMAEEKCTVFINGRHSDEVSLLVDSFQKRGLKVFPASANIVEEKEVEEIVSTVISQTGKIDILVNNIGVYNFKPIENLTTEDWDNSMISNWRSTFLLCKHFIPKMKPNNWGRIINISSVRGLSGRKNGSPYNVSKGGILSFTQGLALELGPFKITCNSIAPGYILTEGMKEEGAKTGINYTALEQSSPLQRLGKPEDVANLAAFLASPLSDFITGQTIVIDGGSFI